MHGYNVDPDGHLEGHPDYRSPGDIAESESLNQREMEIAAGGDGPWNNWGGEDDGTRLAPEPWVPPEPSEPWDFEKIAQREFNKVVARRSADIEDARPEIEDRLEKRFARKGNDFHALDSKAREKLIYEEAAFDSQTTIIVLKDGSTMFNHSSLPPDKYEDMVAHATLFHADADSLTARFIETNEALQSYNLGRFEQRALQAPSLRI